MFSFFSPFPFLRILCVWIFGILIHENLLFLTLLPLLCLDFDKRRIGLLAILGISFLRLVQLASFHDSNISTHDAFVFQINQAPTKGPKSWIIRADVLALRQNAQWHSVHLQCLLYVPLKNVTLVDGQVIQGLGHLSAFRPQVMPLAFDWSRYYASQGIFATAFLTEQNLNLLHDSKAPTKFYLQLREQAKYYLHVALPAGVHRNVADAMFLGIGNSLDFDTRQSYAALGAIHILSVSGMHVGLLYLGLSILFAFLLRFRSWGSWVYFGLIMSILWTYAAMTGFSAPVMRSVWMFSVMLFAKVFRMHSHPLNSWAFSGFVILVIQPMELFQVGFQLSFAAVLGLILFQGRLVLLYTSKYWLLTQVWELTCVAISAQLLTWPLIIYYFHQFPNLFYFFLLNPMLILLSTITLGLGFLYLILAPILSYIPALLTVLGQILLLSFELLHGLMFSTTHQFQTVISFVRLNGIELGCYYLGFGLLWFWWVSRRIYGLYFSGVLLVAILIYRLIEPFDDQAYLTVAEKKLVFIRSRGIHGEILGDPSPVWVQSNVASWWATNQIVDTLTHPWPSGSFTWNDHGREFVYLQHPSIQTVQHPVHLILASDLDLRDARFLQTWQASTWYFIRKPSAYRLDKLKAFLPKKVYYLSEQSAVHFP